MATIRVSTQIQASVEEVWAVVENVADHVNWMKDAESITFIGGRRSGVGTQFDCATKVGPIRLNDRIEITEWIPRESIGVIHEGLVKGEGRFSLTTDPGGGTLFMWEETLHFPFWMGGPLRNPVGAKILSSIWEKNLQLLKEQVEKGTR